MKEKMVFVASGLIKDPNNTEELELWGHDGGEFVLEEVEELIEALKTKKDGAVEKKEEKV